MRAPLDPIGWPSAIAPPLTLTRAGSSSSPRTHAMRLRGEGLVQLDEVEVARAPSRARERLLPRGDRALRP